MNCSGESQKLAEVMNDGKPFVDERFLQEWLDYTAAGGSSPPRRIWCGSLSESPNHRLYVQFGLDVWHQQKSDMTDRISLQPGPDLGIDTGT